MAELVESGFDWDTFTEGNRDATEIAFICEKLIHRQSLRQCSNRFSLKEPDLKFEHDGIYYGIAAKRISSAKQIEKRVKEARLQL
jgi:hypothetical protein